MILVGFILGDKEFEKTAINRGCAFSVAVRDSKLSQMQLHGKFLQSPRCYI